MRAALGTAMSRWWYHVFSFLIGFNKNVPLHLKTGVCEGGVVDVVYMPGWDGFVVGC